MVQRYAHTWATDPPLPADNGKWVTYADHARIVAEMEQAHAAALADAVGYRCYCKGGHDDGCQQDYYVWQQSVTAAAPRTLTADDRPDYKWDQDEVDDLRRQNYKRGLADARAAVTALDEHDSCVGFNGPAIYREDALDAIDALIHGGEATPQGEPTGGIPYGVQPYANRPPWMTGEATS